LLLAWVVFCLPAGGDSVPSGLADDLRPRWPEAGQLRASLSDDVKQMPVTEEACKFFYNVMLAMCQMGKKMDAFFSQDENVAKAISGGSGWALMDKKD
jgi:hypothetical protein